MANELSHISVGAVLTQTEWEAVGAHAFASQATGDIGYASSATQLTRLAIGTANQVLIVSSGLPAWSTTLTAMTFSGIQTGTWVARWSGGTAITAAQYEVTRDADGTNQMHLNVPTGAGFEFSINDVAELVLNATNLQPGANDGVALGLSGTAFSDLFLASGAVVNFAAGDVTLTHSAGVLTTAGLTLIDVAAGILELNDAARFDTGVAMVAGSYSVGRDADATNQLHFNAPTGATFEFSINDVSKFELNGTRANLIGVGATIRYRVAADSDQASGLDLNSGTARGIFGVEATTAGGNWGTSTAASSTVISVVGNFPLHFVTNSEIRASITGVGILKVGGSVAVRATTEGTWHLDIFDGTAPVGTLANGISLYSTAGELRVMDAGGAATLLSPHDDEGNWIFDSVNTVTGARLKVHMEKLVRKLEEMYGWGFVEDIAS